MWKLLCLIICFKDIKTIWFILRLMRVYTSPPPGESALDVSNDSGHLFHVGAVLRSGLLRGMWALDTGASCWLVFGYLRGVPLDIMLMPDSWGDGPSFSLSLNVGGRGHGQLYLHSSISSLNMHSVQSLCPSSSSAQLTAGCQLSMDLADIYNFAGCGHLAWLHGQRAAVLLFMWLNLLITVAHILAWLLYQMCLSRIKIFLCSYFLLNI